jgi:hypothetical protein
MGQRNGGTPTSPAFVFAAVVLGVLLVIAVLAVVWRITASSGIPGTVPLFGVYGGASR